MTAITKNSPFKGSFFAVLSVFSLYTSSLLYIFVRKSSKLSATTSIELSRLGRSTRDLLNIIDVLQQKKVTLVSSKENIDTNTPQGRFVLSIFAALSELEREQTLQRQREGIAIAKSQGKYKGRQPISVDWENFAQLYEQWKSGRITAVEFRKRMKLNKNTFYRRVREYESKL